MNHSSPNTKPLIALLLILIVATLFSCTDTKNKSQIIVITSAKQLNKISLKAKNRLLMFDLFDEGCRSCHLLLPVLEEIAKEQKDKVTVYKIDAANVPEIAILFGASVRPYVVYVKNQNAVHAIAGRQPKDVYISAINRYAN